MRVPNDLCSSIHSAGAAVELAYRGDEALARLHGRHFDLLISDVAMPGMDGYELIRRLREENGARPIRAIAVSAFADLDHHKQSRAAGYEIHISKPVLPDTLIRAVAAVVGSNSRH
jgi:CheY-like chemotaxis protein